MNPRLVAVAVLLALVLNGLGVALAQDASPDASPVAGGLPSSVDQDRLDLAAMVLTAEELPPGYVNVDERYFLSARGVATSFSSASDGLSPEEVEATGLRAMYDSF